MPPKLSICIPVYNEQDNLVPLYQAIVAAVDAGKIDIEIIMADDGSADGSWERIRELVEIDPRVRGVKLAYNCGETAASDAALRAARGEYVMTMDADLQNDPADIPAFMEKLAEGWDCVCGTRVATRHKGDDWIRVVSSRTANWVRNRLSRENISDAGCTYRAFRRQCMDRIKLYRGLHRFIPTLLKMEGYTVAEIPVTNHRRLHGESKYGVWNRLFKSFRDLLAIRWMKSRLLDYRIAEHLDRTQEAETRPAAFVTSPSREESSVPAASNA